MTGRTLRRHVSRLRRAVAALALAAFVVLSTIGPSLALCVGADGHVDLEPIRSPCCDDAGRGASGNAGDPANVAAAATDGTPDDCGDCVDLALTGDIREQANRRVVADLSALPPDTRAVLSLEWTVGAGCVRVPLPPPRAAAVRTVVLRC